MFFPPRSANTVTFDEDLDSLTSGPTSPKVRAVAWDHAATNTPSTPQYRRRAQTAEEDAPSNPEVRPKFSKAATTSMLRKLTCEDLEKLQDVLECQRRKSIQGPSQTEGREDANSKRERRQKRSLVRVAHLEDGNSLVRSVGTVLLPRRSATGVRERLSSARVDSVLAELHKTKSRGSLSGAICESGESSKQIGDDEPYDPRDDDTYLKGFVIDFIIRRGAYETSSESSKAKVARDLVDLVMDEEHASYVYAQDAVARDELESLLWEDIIEFYKNDTEGAGNKINKASWPKATPGRLREHVRAILTYKRHVNNLKAEVGNWIFRYCLLNPRSTDNSESERERHNRLNEFWDQYHALGKLNALPPLPNVESARSKKVAASKPKATSLVAKSSVCFDAKRQWREVEYVESQKKNLPRTNKPLKMTSRHGMAFDERGLFSMKWQLREPAEGTRAALLRHEARIRSHRESIKATDEAPLRHSSSLPSLRPESAKAAAVPSLSKDDESISSLNDEATERYLLACRRCGIRPTPIAFVTGHSAKLHAAGKDLTDSDLRAISAMVQHVSRIEEVDLSHNAMLTESALVPFLQRLLGEPAESTLQCLALRDCQRVGLVGCEAIVRLLSASNGAKNLATLDLSQINLNPKSYILLAKAVGKHAHIASLLLSNTGLGSSIAIAKECVGHILHCPSLCNLDIGWNCFSSEIFYDIGELLTLRKKVKSLCLCNCAADTFGNNSVAPPITFFLEFLSLDTTLTKLDVSLNRIDFRSMLVIEDHLAKNKRLEKLDISNNPLGILGMRSALRLLSLDSSGLIFFDCAGSYFGSEIGAQTFHMTNPGGQYSLDLSRPYHRSILRMLYKSCDRLNEPPERLFKQIKFTKRWSHCSKDGQGIYEVPREGHFECVFNMEPAIERSVHAKNYDFASFVEQHSNMMKMTLGYRKVIPVFACWKQLDGQMIDQGVFLDALGKDFNLSSWYLEAFASFSRSLRSETIHRLLPCLSGGQTSLALGLLLFPSVGDFLRMHKVMRTFLDFNIMNPTGHYKLRLESCTDYFIAERLMLLDRWEVVLDKKLRHFDTSQRGNRSHIRNERYRGHPLHLEFNSLAEWALPEVDVLEFDYITGNRCPSDAIVVNERAFDNILVSLFDAECTSMSKLEVLRKLSHHFFITATQMRTLLGCFKSQAHRAEAFVALYLQIVDMWNAKVVRVRFDSVAEVRNLQERLGYATFFPFIQPENASFELDLKLHDQRLCASLVVQLAQKECAGNIHEPIWIHSDGKVDPFYNGVPQIWSKFAEMPKEGIFRCKYMCAPENRKFFARTSLGETYGAFCMKVKEDQVMWWTGLNEPPPDVLAFLEFIMAKYKDVWKAFTIIDGPGGNGEISRREFRDGVANMGCNKFKDHDEHARIDKVFTYLDPGGEGSVSKGEWDIFHQLQKEYRLCITEFVQFLNRNFGDLTKAWKVMDDDGSGDLDHNEWQQAIERIGYFGPSECVFGILDHSGDGNISKDEFAVLTDYIIDDGHRH